MPIYYKIAKLVLNPERASLVTRIHISQPDTEQEESLGRLLILTEFPSKKADYQALFNLLIEQFSIAYYENEQVLLLNKLATVTVASIFEAAVNKINQILFELQQTQSIKFSSSELSLTLAVIHENKIHFASIGRNQALLIYKPKSQVGISETALSLINISKKTRDSKDELFAPNKVLANIISGQVPQNGYFIFSNEALYEYLSENKLIKIISTLPPSGASAQIENELQQTHLAIPFSLIIIKNHKGQHQEQEDNLVSPAPEPELRSISTHRTHMPSRPERDINKESIRSLNLTEDQTAAILKPSGIFNYRKAGALFTSLASSLRRQPKQKLKVLPAKIFERKQRLVSWQKIFNVFATIAVSIWTLVLAISSQITDRDKRNNWLTRMRLIKSRITKTHLIMMGVVLVCLSLFIANAYRLNQESARKRMHEEVAELIKAIEKEESQIEADLLYGNKDKARNSLAQIGIILRDFPKQMNDEEKARYDIKNASYQEKLAKINSIAAFENLEAVASSKDGTLNNLASSGDYLYLTVDNKIVKVDKQSKTFKTLSDLDSDLKFGSTDNNGVYWLLSAGKNMIQINPSDSVKRFALEEAPDNIKGLEVYYNKLYLYTDTDKQVYRYQLTSDGFRSKSAWLKNPEGLDAIRSLSIDGFVYLLDKNTIHQFGSGRPQNFSLSPVEPSLANPSKVIALKEKDYVYVLEPEAQRVVVYNKKGNFLAQYKGAELDKLSDIAVDEKSVMIYLLSGTTVYQAKLPMPTVSR